MVRNWFLKLKRDFLGEYDLSTKLDRTALINKALEVDAPLNDFSKHVNESGLFKVTSLGQDFLIQQSYRSRLANSRYVLDVTNDITAVPGRARLPFPIVAPIFCLISLAWSMSVLSKTAQSSMSDIFFSLIPFLFFVFLYVQFIRREKHEFIQHFSRFHNE